MIKLFTALSKNSIPHYTIKKNNLQLNKFIAWTESNYQEPIGLKDIAKEFSYDPNYFSSMFKKLTGSNYIDFLNTMRITKVKSELLKGKSLIDICSNSGFSSPSYLIKVFRKVTGYTPAVYVKLISNGQLNDTF